MLKYLIIQLCDTAPSFCHYKNNKNGERLVSIEDLKAGIVFGMKENLYIQFIYPDYILPPEYKEIIDSIDHIDIISSRNADSRLREEADIIVVDLWEDIQRMNPEGKSLILRSSKDDFFKNYSQLLKPLSKAERLNVVFTDIPDFKEEDFETYKKVLSEFSVALEKKYLEGKLPQINILTDRMFLKEMNNCNAGDEVITLAPDGKFYICPAFYFDGFPSSGDLKCGLDIKNSRLYKLQYAPICRNCDAYQCKRCVWLNERQTEEVNIPGREQCVVSHLERNQSGRLLHGIRKKEEFLPEIEIKEIDYLDPFEIVNRY